MAGRVWAASLADVGMRRHCGRHNGWGWGGERGCRREGEGDEAVGENGGSRLRCGWFVDDDQTWGLQGSCIFEQTGLSKSCGRA